VKEKIPTGIAILGCSFFAVGCYSIALLWLILRSGMFAVIVLPFFAYMGISGGRGVMQFREDGRKKITALALFNIIFGLYYYVIGIITSFSTGEPINWTLIQLTPQGEGLEPIQQILFLIMDLPFQVIFWLSVGAVIYFTNHKVRERFK
jgi:hypothetical protein